MTIFECILDQTFNIGELESYLKVFDKIFDSIGADPNDYYWDFSSIDLDDLEEVRKLVLENLMFGAQDMGILSEFLDVYDFSFNEGIYIDLEGYTDEELEDIIASLDNFEKVTGITVDITNNGD